MSIWTLILPILFVIFNKLQLRWLYFPTFTFQSKLPLVVQLQLMIALPIWMGKTYVKMEFVWVSRFFVLKKIVLGSLQILNWFNFIFSLFQQLSAQRLPQMLAWIMPMGKQFAIMEIVLVSSFSLVEREITWKWSLKANCIQWYESIILNRSSSLKKIDQNSLEII